MKLIAANIISARCPATAFGRSREGVARASKQMEGLTNKSEIFFASFFSPRLGLKQQDIMTSKAVGIDLGTTYS